MHDHAAGNAFWLSTTSPMMVELAKDFGFTRLVFDLEHGLFDQSALDLFTPFCRAMGFEVYAKVLGPNAPAIQQALDFGADGVIIPHVEGIEHAREVTGFAKYPPLGTRSYAAGRIVTYGAPPPGFFEDSNARIKCYPMVESAAALADIGSIAQLPTVDGLFVGPTDLALSCGRQRYAFDDADRAALAAIATAARAAGKPWIMPAWTEGERRFSREHGVGWMVTLSDHGVARGGFAGAVPAMSAEA
ncbi:aldolase/citrate lyase family protein [Sphingomonas sp. MG17]|jgi:4-hydroxy-2-oxoheptanedioate aldolase|uniref:Aldolase/citrate lyase family protein n=1 Tax=Sphingomonas tagetis TaxID=2949092 RepID=A0A9X2HJ96_9SPHN|nr:aldolase/citrate lyase family protein [Sphingomonas tagetis]MCP3731057.1 aldolase/citrate lyase family protein [Sphingomonas tagetis]